MTEEKIYTSYNEWLTESEAGSQFDDSVYKDKAMGAEIWFQSRRELIEKNRQLECTLHDLQNQYDTLLTINEDVEDDLIKAKQTILNCINKERESIRSLKEEIEDLEVELRKENDLLFAKENEIKALRELHKEGCEKNNLLYDNNRKLREVIKNISTLL